MQGSRSGLDCFLLLKDALEHVAMGKTSGCRDVSSDVGFDVVLASSFSEVLLVKFQASTFDNGHGSDIRSSNFTEAISFIKSISHIT